MRRQLKSQRVKIFFKASARTSIYGEFFSKFPQEFFHRSWVSYTGKFRKIPLEVCSGGQTKLQNLQYSLSDKYKYHMA